MSVFKFKKFDIQQLGCAQKVGTDSMVLGAFVEHNNPVRILDIGTGNGILSLMMAQKFNTAEITAVEIQKKCAELAQFNFTSSQYRDQLTVINADIKDCEFVNKFDLIISNPPFFDNAFKSSEIERTTARHQTSLKLHELIRLAAGHLMINGAIWLIVPEECSLKLIKESQENGLMLSRKIKIFGKPDLHKRDILCFTKSNGIGAPKHDDFTVRSIFGGYTEEYKAKTIDFHHTQL